jgi:hypothetical protein
MDSAAVAELPTATASARALIDGEDYLRHLDAALAAVSSADPSVPRRRAVRQTVWVVDGTWPGGG